MAKEMSFAKRKTLELVKSPFDVAFEIVFEGSRDDAYRLEASIRTELSRLRSQAFLKFKRRPEHFKLLAKGIVENKDGTVKLILLKTKRVDTTHQHEVEEILSLLGGEINE